MNTYSLYDNAVTTCMGNDYGYEYIFSRPLDFLSREGDMLVAISSSGNSRNIINAIETAQKKKASVVTLTGFEPGNLAKLHEKGYYAIVVTNQSGVVRGLFEAACREFEIDMENSYMMGGWAGDILAGQKAGVKTVLVESGYGTARLVVSGTGGIMAKTVGIGIQDFCKVIENNCFYVDKTLFIKEWWESQDEVTLITRPRRFGKTLNMSMVEHFFL